ncbi:protein of unassigned function [Methylobacterium oryzae CBMB20]|uniref:Protein of unassigned function n=1 Tax=Methylobacterium oryzae CBMB20 TaxID=693986 RepID=A0A089P1W0_9HYPH|nr:protein of unassigned function [Methylobacterium oryzae CBMB20]
MRERLRLRTGSLARADALTRRARSAMRPDTSRADHEPVPDHAGAARQVRISDDHGPYCSGSVTDGAALS